MKPDKPNPGPAWLRGTALLLAAGFASAAEARDRYSYFFNESHDTIRSVQVRQRGDDAWTDVDVGAGIGSGQLRRLHLHADGRGRCLYDIQTTFDHGPVLLHRQMDLCGVATYYPENYRRLAIRIALQSDPHRLSAAPSAGDAVALSR